MIQDQLIHSVTPLIKINRLIDTQSKNIDFYLKNETVNNNGLFTDRIAKRLF